MLSKSYGCTCLVFALRVRFLRHFIYFIVTLILFPKGLWPSYRNHVRLYPFSGINVKNSVLHYYPTLLFPGFSSQYKDYGQSLPSDTFQIVGNIPL
jgi:hypothetical protein